MTSDIFYWSATELVAAYRQKKLSPVEYMHMLLERIETLNPLINAFFYVDHEGAKRAAQASESRWLHGNPMGPLDGVPFSAKDHILTIDMPSVWGVKGIDPAGPWLIDAPIIARLKEAGAILIGKTTQPELAMFCSGVSGLYGITRNPWDLSKSPGGSSSGAAAALAAGLGPIALGSDGGGSIRIPAAYTGVVGHKPTFGRIPFFPPFGPGVVYGPMTRCVEDLGTIMTIVTQADWRDIYALPPETRDYAAEIKRDLTGLRIAYSENFGYGTETSPEVSALTRAALETLKNLGATVEEIPPFFDFNVYNALGPSIFPALRMMTAAVGVSAENLLPEIQAAMAKSTGTTLDDFFIAKGVETQARLTIAAAFSNFDFLVTPTMPTVAYEADRCFPKNAPLNDYDYSFDHNPFTWPFNLTLQPATSVPCGLTAQGLPVGLQIVGQRGDDIGCLAAAYAYENARPHSDPWPILRS